jgi:outer membrane protein OmpA-like peptidoglycan-associated protein
MQANREWISISDMMAGLMMVFLFIAVLFMSEVQKEQKAIKKIAESYQNIQQQLYKDLNQEFKKDLKTWDAEILQDNTIRFQSPEVLFDTNSSELKAIFIVVLDNFFPRYLDILTNNKYKKQIKEIRVEGHTSSVWKNATREQSYINNMFLSQNRAKSVLAYSYNITSATNKVFLENVFRANGMSFSKLIKENGEVVLIFKGRSYKGNKHGPMNIGVAVADSFEGPYRVVGDKPFFSKDRFGVVEDPHMWADKKGFHTIKSQDHTILDSCEKAAESCPVKIIVVKDPFNKFIGIESSFHGALLS